MLFVCVWLTQKIAFAHNSRPVSIHICMEEESLPEVNSIQHVFPLTLTDGLVIFDFMPVSYWPAQLLLYTLHDFIWIFFLFWLKLGIVDWGLSFRVLNWV